MEKYGFVYIWYDRKHKRYYVGCRWGSVDDGYVCSSSWMKIVYKYRPNDFKRRILKTNINDKKMLLEEEYHYLKMIKDGELGKKYYNLHNHYFSHWSTNNNNLNIRQKISLAKQGKYEGENNPFYGKTHSDETKKIIKEKRAKQIFTIERNKKASESVKGEKNHFYGKEHNSETKSIIKNKIKELWKDPKYREMMLKSRKKKEIM